MARKSMSEIKDAIDIVDYISDFIPLVKKGANFVAPCPFHSEDSASFSVSPTKQICHCFGCGKGGDIFDFIELYHGVSKMEAKEKALAYAGGEREENSPQRHNPLPKKEKPAKDAVKIKKDLAFKANKLLANNKDFTIFIPIDNSDIIAVSPVFEKLLEHSTFRVDKPALKRLNYITSELLAYDDFFKCPAIIMRDDKRKVADISKYRAIDPKEGKVISKYLYQGSEKTLDNRGEDFLFPLSFEMKILISRHNFFFIGEGLKNALVAFVFGVPYISIESVSSGISDELIDYVKELSKTKQMIGAFDGDGGYDGEKFTKGRGGYERLKKMLEKDFKNLFSFDSGLDFADYMADQKSLVASDLDFNTLFKLEA